MLSATLCLQIAIFLKQAAPRLLRWLSMSGADSMFHAGSPSSQKAVMRDLLDSAES